MYPIQVYVQRFMWKKYLFPDTFLFLSKVLSQMLLRFNSFFCKISACPYSVRMRVNTDQKNSEYRVLVLLTRNFPIKKHVSFNFSLD